MTPLLLLGAGLVLLVAAAIVLRSFGPRLRVGRLLAATPRVSIADARALAEAGERRYVRIDGRIDSSTEFEDADHRPLVLRRTRLQARERGAWRTFEDDVEQVAFELNEGLDSIAIDGAAVGDGLVVVPRESTGVARDLGERAAGLAAETPVRVRIEQLSSVEHASALGVPILDDGRVVLTAGLGRPLVVSTLESREAMRVLAEGRTLAPRVSAALIGGGLLLSAVGLVAAGAALAAEPSGSPLAGDPRSSGEGPGLVGEPLLAIGAVVAIAVLAVIGTLLWIRATTGRRPNSG